MNDKAKKKARQAELGGVYTRFIGSTVRGDMKNLYYEQGYKAYNDGVSYFSCPYCYTTEKHAAYLWCEGWEQAEEGKANQ